MSPLTSLQLCTTGIPLTKPHLIWHGQGDDRNVACEHTAQRCRLGGRPTSRSIRSRDLWLMVTTSPCMGPVSKVVSSAAPPSTGAATSYQGNRRHGKAFRPLPSSKARQRWQQQTPQIQRGCQTACCDQHQIDTQAKSAVPAISLCLLLQSCMN